MIQLTDKLAVTANNECYIVGKPGPRADGGIKLRDPSYYPTLAQAVRGAVSRTLRQRVADDEITTLQDFIREAEGITADFTEKLKALEM